MRKTSTSMLTQSTFNVDILSANAAGFISHREGVSARNVPSAVRHHSWKVRAHARNLRGKKSVHYNITRDVFCTTTTQTVSTTSAVSNTLHKKSVVHYTKSQYCPAFMFHSPDGRRRGS